MNKSVKKEFTSDNPKTVLYNLPKNVTYCKSCLMSNQRPDTTAEHYNKNEKRPLISHIKTKISLKEFVSKHLFERSSFYEMAQIKINVDKKSIPEIVGEILPSLE